MGKWKEVDFGKIPVSWEVKPIIDIISQDKRSIAMGPFGSNIKVENFVTEGVPVIRGKNFNYDRYVGGDFVFLTQEKADELIGSNCNPGDIVFTHRGTIGQVGLIPEKKYRRYVISQSGMKLTVDLSLINNEFLFYFFKSRFGQFQILKYESQVGVPSISNPLTSLKEIDVPVPPLPEQKAIAGVLSSLDDKIDLLHRQNKTLEAMAETLFRQWFIEEAQEDWEEKPLDEIAGYLNGLACQKYPPKNDSEKLPVLKIKELKNGFTENSDWATTDVKEDYIVQSGEIIFSWSGSLLVKIWDDRKCVLNQHLFKVTSNKYPKWFIYLWTKFHLKKFIAIAESKATTMGHIKRADLSSSMVLIPPMTELEVMDKLVAPLINKVIINNRQIRKLEKMRDTLLPKLMSGEVRVII